jgi:hypothetical protein
VPRSSRSAIAAAWPALAGVAAVLLVDALLRAFSASPRTVSLTVLLLPVIAVAFLGGTLTTTVVALFAAAVGSAEFFSYGDFSSLMRARYAALLVGCLLLIFLARLRRNREDTVAHQQAQLLAAQEQIESEDLMRRILERSPQLSEASDTRRAAQLACDLARELFGVSATSYWQVEDGDCVLWARSPLRGPWPIGYRVPKRLFDTAGRTMLSSRSAWQSRAELSDPADARRVAMDLSHAHAGTSTPVVVGDQTIAYLALNWDGPRSQPTMAWANALDRFADQLALAKSVIRRRNAQAESARLVRRLQAGLLPAVTPEDGSTVIRTLYRPGQRQMLLGGDFLDVRREGGTVSFILGDVSGHGPEQAALGTLLRAAWMGLVAVPGTSLKEWVPALDRILTESRSDDAMYATVVMGQISPADRALRYVTAGHPAPILCTPELRVCPQGGPPLGLGLDVDHEVHMIELPEPDWSVLVVTDGIYEGRIDASTSERVGFSNFLTIVANETARPICDPAFLDALADDLQRRNGGPLPDDAAAILVTPHGG